MDVNDGYCFYCRWHWEGVCQNPYDCAWEGYRTPNWHGCTQFKATNNAGTGCSLQKLDCYGCIWYQDGKCVESVPATEREKWNVGI